MTLPSKLELMRRAMKTLGEGIQEGQRLAKICHALEQVEWFEDIDGRRVQGHLHAPARHDLAGLLPILKSKYGNVPEVKQLADCYTLRVRDACPAVGWPPTSWAGSATGIVTDFSRPQIVEARALSESVQLTIVDKGMTRSTSLPIKDPDVRRRLAEVLSGAKGMALETAGDLSFFVVQGDAEAEQRG